MSRIAVYYNEKASQSSSKSWKKELQEKLFRHDLSFKSPGSISELRSSLMQDIEDDIEAVFSIGGDGTANLMIQELAGSKVKLFIIPTGTANDLATGLGIKQSINRITQIYQNRSTAQVDLIDINGSLMATNGGIGVANKVAEDVNKYRNKIPGFKTIMSFAKGRIYSAVLGKELLSKNLKYYKLKIDSPDFKLKNNIIETPMLFINNQPILGGKFEIAPDTESNDGRFNITFFTHKKRTDLIKCIAKIRTGKFPYDDPEVISFETSKITITNTEDEKIAFFGDGEQINKAKSLCIQISEKKLNMFCGASYSGKVVEERSYSLNSLSPL